MWLTLIFMAPVYFSQITEDEHGSLHVQLGLYLPAYKASPIPPPTNRVNTRVSISSMLMSPPPTLKRMPGLWIETPLIRSQYISDRLNCDVYLKLENLQPSQSFKYRGISLFAEEALKQHGTAAHLIVASGGNAGYATCMAAQALSLKCSVFITEEARSMGPLVEATGATVYIGGKYYRDALEMAQAAVASDQNAVLVPAYDHPTLWKGHSSMVHEIAHQLPGGVKPDVLVCAVGGGGLLGGIILGCKDVGWDDVPLLAMETQLSNCFYQSFLANGGKPPPDPKATGNKAIFRTDDEHKVTLAQLTEITSRASCLGASSPSAGVLKAALERTGPLSCVCVSDEQSMGAAVKFHDEHKMMVELACSTALAPAYDPRILAATVPRTANQRQVIVFVVCGGIKVTLEEMVEYRALAEGHALNPGAFWVNGKTTS